MNVEITAYVDVPGDDEKAEAEVDRIATRFAGVLAGRYGIESRDGQSRVRSVVVVKCARGTSILVPAKGEK